MNEWMKWMNEPTNSFLWLRKFSRIWLLSLPLLLCLPVLPSIHTKLLSDAWKCLAVYHFQASEYAGSLCLQHFLPLFPSMYLSVFCINNSFSIRPPKPPTPELDVPLKCKRQSSLLHESRNAICAVEHVTSRVSMTSWAQSRYLWHK